jgi:hypothetical protein
LVTVYFGVRGRSISPTPEDFLAALRRRYCARRPMKGMVDSIRWRAAFSVRLPRAACRLPLPARDRMVAKLRIRHTFNPSRGVAIFPLGSKSAFWPAGTLPRPVYRKTSERALSLRQQADVVGMAVGISQNEFL